MGVDGEYRPLVGIRSFVVCLLIAGLTVPPALAQRRIETPRENVERRQAETARANNPYWDGFILKHQGNCTEAITKLEPLARRGFGFEDAQTALGECYLQLAGLDMSSSNASDREALLAKKEFDTALLWIGRAAQAGHFQAQAVMVSLYAAGLGPNEDLIEGSKWAHLYLTNPSRLNLGAPISAIVSIDQLKEQMNNNDWLLGKQRARDWVPTYAGKAPQLPDPEISPQ